MTVLISSPATLSVTSFPYSLPASGQAILIGANVPENVRPPTHTVYDWNWGLFMFYGGGTFVDDYSAGGAYVIAGSGGHAVPPNFGGCLFDFEDAKWKRIDNANGMPWRNYDLTSASEINSFGEINHPGVSAGIPAPSHIYGNVLPLSAANGGGSRGSALLLRSAAAGSDSNRGSPYAHRFDLATGLWTRHSTNRTIGDSGFRSACYDRTTNRYYMIRYQVDEDSSLDYLDGADWTWKKVGIATPAYGGHNKSAFIDDARRLLIVQTSTNRLRAIDLNNLGAGFVTLRTAGNLPPDNQSQWHLYPADGCWYTYMGNGGNNVHKIQPPAENPLTSTWNVSTVSIGGATLASQPKDAIDAGAVHNTRFFYVRPIGCFAWIAGERNQVAILKP